MTVTARRALRRLLSLLDSEAIAPLQAVFYAFFVLAGAYMIVLATQPVSQVEQVLGPVAEHVWSAMLVAGPLLWFIGRRMSGTPAAWVGLWLLLWGDVTACTALTVYSWSVAEATPWGTGTFAPFLGAATAVCIALLVARDVRRIAQVVHAARRQ